MGSKRLHSIRYKRAHSSDVALVLQRSAGDALDREVEALDVILAEGARNRRLV